MVGFLAKLDDDMDLRKNTWFYWDFVWWSFYVIHNEKLCAIKFTSQQKEEQLHMRSKIVLYNVFSEGFELFYEQVHLLYWYNEDSKIKCNSLITIYNYSTIIRHLHDKLFVLKL